MITYKVFWHTSVGMGATFYEGVEIVRAEDEESASDIAQYNVWRRAFQDWGKSHIIITNVVQS